MNQKQKRGFLGMLLGALGPILLANLLTGKGTLRAGEAQLEPVKLLNAPSSFN